MRKLALTLVPLLLLACDRDPVVPSVPDTPLFSQAPVDGNGNKAVFRFDVTFPVDCSTQTLTLNIHGWVQIRVFGQPNNRNVELDVFHGLWTFTNSAGKSFVWHDVGPDHYYIDTNGDLIVAITGRATESGVIGTVRVNLTTGEVKFVAGNQFEITDLACAALT
jgi:hypothetical protein